MSKAKITISTAIIHRHKKYMNEHLEPLFTKFKGENPSIETDLIDNAQKRMLSLTISPPNKLLILNEEFSSYCINNGLKRLLKNLKTALPEIYIIFSRIHCQLESIDHTTITNPDYIERIRVNWCAYSFLASLDVRVCPYCEMQHIETYFSKDSQITRGTSRADLDHFFPKGIKQYPLLSMSIYNLVPSCKSCNSSIKSSTLFDFKLAVSPYSEDISSYFSFTRTVYTNTTDIVDAILGYSNNYDINTEINEHTSDSRLNRENYNRAKYMLDFFHVTNRYSYHKEYLSQQLKLQTVYNEQYIKTLEKYDIPSIALVYPTALSLYPLGTVVFSKISSDYIGKALRFKYYYPDNT